MSVTAGGFSEDQWEHLALDTLGELAWKPLHGKDIAPGTGERESWAELRADEARLREAVEVARAHDRSWNQIAVALGISRQAARQRFIDKTHA